MDDATKKKIEARIAEICELNAEGLRIIEEALLALTKQVEDLEAEVAAYRMEYK